ncbi:hypothetical protein ACQ86O_23070 [Serratia sp. L9]|uniref:hypothetical protein n=1 Tax=Serratia sp. L9 TaxID=3423946 RepID=UPI003D675429
MLAAPVSITQTLRERLCLLRGYTPMLLGWLLFMAGIAIAALMNEGTGLYTVAKYLALLFVLVCLVVISPLSPALLEKSLSVALVVSLIPLILLALFRQLDAMVILGDGRMGWLASWPGVIWKIGAFVWPFAIWRCLRAPSFRNVLLAFCAVLTMALDGSRTSMLWLVLVWLTLAIIAAVTRANPKPVRTHISLLFVTLFSFAAIQPVLLSWVSGHYDPLVVEFNEWRAKHNQESGNEVGTEESGNALIGNFMSNLGEAFATPKDSTADRLLKGDNSTRLEMLQIGWKQTVDKFPWGAGFGSTRVMDFGASSVIHMTYLQLLADDGVLAFVGYLLFLLFPAYCGLKFVTEKRELFVERFELLLCPLSALALFLFMGCFHPLSNELTEWGIVLTAIAILVTHVPRRN